MKITVGRILILFVLGFISVADLSKLSTPNAELVKNVNPGQLIDLINYELRDSDFLRKGPNNETITLSLDDFTKELTLRDNESEFCPLCRLLMGTMITLRRLGASQIILQYVTLLICILLGLSTENVCAGMINLNIEIILYIIDERPDINAYTVCGVVFQSDGCIAGNDPYLEWTINVNERLTNGSKPIVPPPNSNDLTVVQITDTHYDPNYQEGATAVCGEPACCRIKQGPADRPENAAGRWGDYRDCDSPWEAIEDVFTAIHNNHEKIDYIYVTGDYIDHGMWETTFAGNVESIELTFNGLRKIFGNDTPIYPIIGNHEPHPSNQFAPTFITGESLSTIELYNMLADTWYWLPESAKETIRIGGYYTLLVRPGFRIIAMNNNDGYTWNWWLLYDARFASIQLQWLQDTLLQAEQNNEKVHILAHIPAGYGDSFRTYSREYQRIVERYWDTISGQFNGHTHNDQFYVVLERDNPSNAINVGWNGGSATPFSDVNPNYRVYSVEPETYQVTNHETWIYNLTEANAAPGNQPPRWFKEYSFLEAYGLSDLSPASLNELLDRFATDHDLLHLYWQHKVKMGDTSLARGCNNNCLIGELCAIATSLSGLSTAQNHRCQELTTLFWANVK